LAPRPGFAAGPKVLDLGCGLGLPGLVAAARGAEVWFGDREPAALAFVCESLARNGITNAHTVVLDFTRDFLGMRFDQILGAEIVYDSHSYAPLAEFIDRHLADGGAFHVTDAFRGDAVRFFDGLRSRGFRGECAPVREWDNGNWQGAFLWDFRR
jgi:predicted nicotinamide N-methyase